MGNSGFEVFSQRYESGTAVMVSVAREHGITELVEDSSGNAGASVAAYAAEAGIKAHNFCAIHSTTGQTEADQCVWSTSPSDGPRSSALRG